MNAGVVTVGIHVNFNGIYAMVSYFQLIKFLENDEFNLVG